MRQLQFRSPLIRYQLHTAMWWVKYHWRMLSVIDYKMTTLNTSFFFPGSEEKWSVGGGWEKIRNPFYWEANEPRDHSLIFACQLHYVTKGYFLTHTIPNMMVEHNFKPYPPTPLNSSCRISQITNTEPPTSTWTKQNLPAGENTMISP